MKKIFLLISATLGIAFGAESKVLEWSSKVAYRGNEIVWTESRYWLALRNVNGERPGTGKNWQECISFLTPKPLLISQMYRPGDVVQYKGATWVAGHSTKNQYPDPAPNKTAWIKADLTGLKGPIYKLPPDPGEAGRKTVLGIDSDSDGVRDDLQRAITFAFPNDPEKRAAGMQLAMVDREIMAAHLNNAPKPTIRALAEKEALAIDLIFQVKAEKLLENSVRLEALMLNTRDRLIANAKIDQMCSGMVHVANRKQTLDSAVSQREKERQK